ncbi:unnamed protein product [Brassica oleracea]
MAPYPIPPKDNEIYISTNKEYLPPESLPTEENYEEDYLEKLEVTELFCGKKKIFSDDD